MNDYNATGKYYTIRHLAIITGLTDRTIRNYISSGILQGEKINGLWHFTSEQTEAFINHPAVRPSILTKKNAIVYDFLADTKKKTAQTCVIIDLPDADPKETAEFFCYSVTHGNFKNINFSFDSPKNSVPRIILKGTSNDVLGLINQYYNR